VRSQDPKPTDRAPRSAQADAVRRRRRSLVDELILDVLTLVRDEGLTAGSRLPSTSTLAHRFGVATPTMREALLRLQATGVLNIRHGSGTFVRDDAPRMVIANPSRQTAESMMLDVLDARLLIEPSLAESAARRRTTQDGELLHQILGEADAAIAAGDDRRLSEATMAFHAAIAAMAGNVVLAEAVRAITELYADHQLQIGRLFDDRELDQREHRALAVAIQTGQPHKSRRLMTEHLREVRDMVATRLTERSGRGTKRKEA
jgi:GntR family transcriptional repressor for pyruvate dehydrogenase complex